MGNSCTIRWRWRSGRDGGGVPLDKWKPAVAVRIIPGIVEVLIPGKDEDHACTQEVP